MKKQPKRFDMHRKPIKPRWWLRVAEMVAGPIYMLFNNGHVKTEKAVKKMKGPFLILCSHASFMDFPQLMCGLLPRTTGWVMSVEEFRRGDWLMYGIGGIPKRKFTHTTVTAKHMLRYLRTEKQSVALYPEARFSFAGINERLDEALGKLCKHAKVPVLLFKAYGNFINSPQWSKHPYRKIRQEAEISLLFTPEQLEEMSAPDIQAAIEKAFERDEYAWQVEKGYHVKCKKRADGCISCYTNAPFAARNLKCRQRESSFGAMPAVQRGKWILFPACTA